jgi:hypothetical protein
MKDKQKKDYTNRILNWCLTWLCRFSGSFPFLQWRGIVWPMFPFIAQANNYWFERLIPVMKINKITMLLSQGIPETTNEHKSQPLCNIHCLHNEETWYSSMQSWVLVRSCRLKYHHFTFKGIHLFDNASFKHHLGNWFQRLPNAQTGSNAVRKRGYTKEKIIYKLLLYWKIPVGLLVCTLNSTFHNSKIRNLREGPLTLLRNHASMAIVNCYC